MADSVMTTSPFLGGLNTELNGVTDSTDFTRDELNMMVRQDNTRSRRPGVDYEELFQFSNFGTKEDLLDTTNQKLAFNSIEWTDINSPDESQTYKQTPYIVCQVGGYIIFFENKGKPYSANQKDFIIDLKDYRIDETDDESYKTERCKFTTAYGCLFITSNAIHPIKLKSAQEDQHTWTPTATQPHCTVSCGAVTGYCTYTEGRCQVGDWWFAINGTKIFTMTGAQQSAKYPQYVWHPSYWSFPLALTSTQYAAEFNALPSELRLGITCTPKYENAYPTAYGMYTGSKLYEDNYITPADHLVFTAPAGSELTYRGTKVSWGGHFYIYAGFPSYYNDGIMAGGNSYVNQSGLTLTIRDTSVGANDYLSNEEQPEKTSYAHLYNMLNQGWTLDLIAQYYMAQSPHAFPGNNLAQQYLKDKTTEAFKPSTLINTTFGDTPAARGHFILNFFNQDRNTIINLQLAMQSLISYINSHGGSVSLATILDTFDEPLPTTTDEEKAMAAKQVPVVKPRRPYASDICAYAGRIFYLCGDVLLYSQIIAEDTRKASYCYSEADPTSEKISDVVETDGGMISLPEIGEGLKLQQFGTYLMVFGTRGSVLITGTANNNFTATAYTTGTLPAAPTQAPFSFVETEYGIFYWGTTGVNLVTVGENGLDSKDLSTDRILTWFGKLTNTQHKYCKGVYSSSKKRIYWFFPSDDNKPRRLDRILVFDITKNAFMPHKITQEVLNDDGFLVNNNLPEIVSGVSLKVPYKNIKEYPVEAEGDYFKGWYGYDSHFNSEPTASYFTLYNETPVISDNVYIQTVGALTKSLSGTIADYVNHTYNIGLVPVTDTYVTFRSVYGSTESKAFTKCTYTDSSSVVHNYYFQTVTVGETTKAYVFDGNEKFIGESTAYDPVNSSITFTDFATNTSIIASITEDTLDFSLKPVVIKRNPSKDTVETVSDESTYEILDENGIKILADDPIESEEFTYESSLLLCLDVNNAKVTFGDFRNNNMRDWTAGDWEGPGYIFDSYLISHPMNAGEYNRYGQRSSDIVHRKNMPYLISYFKRTETGKTTDGGYVYPSKCQGSVLWDWRTNGDYGKWDSPQELYRPNKREIFSEGYVITKTNIRGLGRAYQVKMESVDDNQFIIEAISTDLKNDGRI